MRKITLLSFFVLFSALGFTQTPCSPISPLDCSEVGVTLPVNLNFSGADAGINNTGFTMVDPPSARLSADDAGADANVPGLLAGNLSVASGSLNVTATNGINFSQLSGSPQSTFTNSQMNALGVGFDTGTNVIDISATIDQPNFAGTSSNGSQQAGIWFGLNENNFVKLVVVKASDTQQKIQMALEQTDPGNSDNLIIEELNTNNFNIGATGNITFRLSIDPSDNSVRGFYSLDGGNEVQVTGATDFLAAPATFNDGVNHDSDIATDALSYAGIMTSKRRGGGSMVISYDSFSVVEDVPEPIADITAPYRMNVAGSDYSKDGNLFLAEDTSYLIETKTTTVSTGSYTVVGGHGDLYHPRRFGEEFSYNFPITNGNYTVVLHMVENFFDTAGLRIFDVAIENVIEIDNIDLVADYGQGVPAIVALDVNVADGDLTIDFNFFENNAIIQAIEVLPITLSDENGIQTFALTEQTGAATIDATAHTVAVEVANTTDLTALVPTITVSADATVTPASGVAQDFTNAVPYTVTADDGTDQVWTVTVLEEAAPLSAENDILTFAFSDETGAATIDAIAHTIAIEVTGGSNVAALVPTITVSDDATVAPASEVAQDFTNPVAYTVTAQDDSEQIWTVTVSQQSIPFEAYINFQDEATTPPAGYTADFGLGFPATPAIGDYGWKKREDGTSIDVNGTNSAGRNRLGTNAYNAADLTGKLEGTLIHFQGDNIASWVGQPRGNELIWEISVPNGTYNVTLGLGDKGAGNVDSRHSATVEGYTIIPAFVPLSGQVKTETMTVAVTDGLLTINGVGGFNSKITHIEIVEGLGTPVAGVLAFNPPNLSESLEAGSSGLFASDLSGPGASDIALVIDDNVDETNGNEWLGLPPSGPLGTYSFSIDATQLADGDTRTDRIIASAKGFVPAELELDLTVTAPVANEVTAPFRMNVAGNDYTKDGVSYLSEEIAYLQEPDLPIEPTRVGTSAITPYTVPGGHTELYYPRRFGAAFSYNFPIANGNYSVALHMVENFQTSASARIFDVSIENELEIDDLDLFADYGKGALALLSFDVEVLDGELNIDFLASENFAIIQAIEILPVIQSEENDILTFLLADQTGDAVIDTDANTVAIEVASGTDLTALSPIITFSPVATIVPDSGVVQNFTIPVDYIVTAENGTEQPWTVTVTVADSPLPQVVINEIMPNPAAVDDAAGEWFELYNPGTGDVDIDGWIIKDNDSDSHEISNGGPLLVPASGYLVLGNNSNVGNNGGIIVGYLYSGFTLANTIDEVVLVDSADNEIDRVDYDDATFPSTPGASMALNAPEDDNAIGSNWSATTAAFGIGDLGTPGITNTGKANESPVITSLDVVDIAENQTAVIDVEVTDDTDSEGSGIIYALTDGVDDAFFAITSDTGIMTFLTEPDFESPADDGADNIYNLRITVSDAGNLIDVQEIAVTVIDVDETVAFEAHINFQDNPSSTTPPDGYLADYGKQFGNASVSLNTNAYQYGWKRLDTSEPIDASDEAANNSNGVGRLRLGNIGNYNAASIQDKLEGTLVHFQGDNIAGWNDGQPRKNELFWELEIPNGTYEVTLGLGDKAADNIDSRHSATVEGYTIISAFSPVSTEVRTASMIVDVSDNLLTIGGLGGFNTKITHIDVIETTDTAVDGALIFLPATASETLEAGASGTFPSELAGVGATDIGLIIDDNIDETGNNDWLALPIKNDLGQYDFAIDATTLLTDDLRNDIIIATSKGFVPAILAADLTVIAGEQSTFAFVDNFDTYGTGNLHEIAPAQWLKEQDGDAAIPVLAEGLTSNTTHSLDFSNGAHAHDLIPLTDNPVDLQPDQAFYFGTYYKVTSVGNRVRTAIRVDDEVAGEQWVRAQVADDGTGGLIARIGLGNPGSNNGITAVDSDEVFQFVVRGEWDGENTINYSWTIDPKLAIEETVWTDAGTHTVQGTPQIGRLFISSAGINDARLGPVRLATDYSAVVTEEINFAPVLEAQSFEVAEDVVVGTTIGTVVASDIDSTILSYAITAGNDSVVFNIDSETGEITTSTTLDFAQTTQYILTVAVGDGANTSSADITINVNDVNEVQPCNPLSTLPCDQISASVPLSLDFTAANGNLSESGFSMVLEPSARLASDDAVADANVPGYAPGLISQDAAGLSLTSTKGIFYSQLPAQGEPSSSDTNSQMNALGTGVLAPSTLFNVSATLENPDFSVSTGNNSQQAGVWYGLDEDHIIKLVVAKTGNTTRKVQLQVENMDETTAVAAYPELNTGNIASNTGNITLRLELDPVNLTAKGYYSLDGGVEILVIQGGENNLSVPASYFAGTSYDTANPSETLNFAGIFTTHRRAAVDQSITAVFKNYEVAQEQQALALSFDVDGLDFSGTAGEAIAPQTVTVSASSGNPTFKLSDDPDASSWLILPEGTVTLPDNTLAFPLGDIEFGIKEDLPVNRYSTTIFATDEPDSGYANAEMTISLEIAEAVNDFAVNINFSDAATPAPANYEQDSGLPFGARDNGLNYGWLETDGTTLLDLSANARNRNYPALDIKQRTLIHMQYGDVAGSNGVLTEGLWEVEVPYGTYRVTVGVGDPDVDGAGTVPTHRINAEGINLIDNFTPDGTAGTATRFTSGSQIVTVSDGRLTLDALNGGFNTKINSIEIVATDAVVQTPRVVGVTPVDGATQVSVTPTISANDLFLPNLDTDGNTGVDNTTITNATVKLFKQGNATPIDANVNGTGGGDAISLVPVLPLETNTTYVFEVDGVLDLVGESFEFFTSSFTTGEGNTGPTTDLDNVSFNNVGSVATGSKYSTLTFGPDGKLYGLVLSGDIHRWSINPDGSLANKETLSAWKSAYGSRTSVGMVFDPAATTGNLIAYVSHDSGGLNGAPEWDGKISRLSGADLQNEELIITDLPRSTKDHLTNSLTFKPGEPNVLYFNQGSNSAAGKPDNAWGNREERLLTAATLRLNLSLLPSTLPLNVRTTGNATAINNVDVNSSTLDGLYNPYFTNAPLTLFATGIRNAYDLVWHSNGQLYVPTNGTAGGSNAPASIDGTRRPDGTFYDHSDALYPIIPASNGNNTQRDWLFRIDPNTGIGYYGHPNPFRGEFVLNRGDVDVNNSVYDLVQPDENYRGAAFDFEFNKSPNGAIEYRSDAENGNLKGALLIVRYSNGNDIIALVPDGPSGDIATFKEGIPGFGGLQDPLDLIEDINTGNIYVSNYGASEIVLLKPSNQAVPTPRIVLNTDAVTGDAITNSDTFTQEVLLSNLGNATLADIDAQLTGTNADQFTIIGLPTSINAQNSGSFSVAFTPTANGPKFAELVISGTNAESVTIPLSGLGKTGSGGGNEPSLQWILDTQLGAGVVNVGDTNPATNLIDLPNGATYNNIFGDEVAVQKFERAIDAPVTLELLSVYGPTANNPITAFGWYRSGDAASTTELFTIGNDPESNGQTLNAPINGNTEFDPGTESFGFYSRWPFFNDRQLFSEDALNTFNNAIPHHVRVYELPGEVNAYIIATEEHVSGFDYQDIVVIARNIRPFDDSPLVACSPISILVCEELEAALPFTLDFDGTEGGLSDTGFTMVDNPSARIAIDGPVFNLNVPGYEPSKLSLSNGNLIINANNGIAYRTNGGGADQSTDVNSQVNTLGVGIDASSYGSFSIETSIVNPYSDSSNDSEQAGIWFGLDEDNFVKFVANVAGGLELRKEVNGISVNGDVDQLSLAVPNLNSSTVGLRLFVDIATNNLTAFYTLNGGVEVEMGSLALPAGYISGNAAYDNLSFAGIFATKRRELAAEVNYTFEDFAITPENTVALVATRINAGGTAIYTDAQSNLWELDETFLTGNSEVSFKTFEVAGTAEDPLFLEYRFSNDDAGQPGTPFGYAIPVTGTGPYTVKLYFIEPFFGIPGGGPGGTGSRVFNVAIEDGQASLTNYDLNAQATPGTLITETFSDITVTDGALTIDFTAITNNAIISAIEVIGSESIAQPFFANVNPDDNAIGVAITDFQINVSVATPEGYELDKATIAGNVNLYRLSGNEEVLVPANVNDSGGGDAITLTPLSELQPFTTYVFRLTSGIEANLIGNLQDRLAFQAFRSDFTTGDGTTVPDLDLTGVEFTKVDLPNANDLTTRGERFSSLVIGPDGKLYASTIGDFASDGQIFRWDMAADGTLENQEILTPGLEGSPDPTGVSRPASNNERLIIGFTFDPSSTADNLVAYITHSQASDSDGPEWDGKLTRLSGPTLSVVQDIIEHLPRSKKDHLTNSLIFNGDGDLFINQGSNSAGGAPDASWDFRPERLLSASVLKLELDKLPNTMPLSAYTTDDIGVINAAPTGSIVMSDNTYNPYAINSPLTIFASGIRNAYDLVWHSNGWLYVPTNGTAGNNSSSPNSPSYTSGDLLARRIDGLTTLPNIPALNGGETQKDWLFKTQGGSYHGHPNPFRGEFVLNHGGAPYSGVPGQEVEPKTDVAKYPDNLSPDPNYREPAYDFGFNKSPNGSIEYKSDAFGGKLQGLLMVVRFSGQDDIIVLQPQGNGNIANVNGDVPGLQGFDDPLDIVEDPLTGNLYISEYDRAGNTNVGLVLLRANTPATRGPEIAASPEELIFETTVNNDGDQTDTKTIEVTNDGNEVLNILSASITGDFGAQFNAVQPAGAVTLNPGESQIYTVTYAPDLENTNLGYQEAGLTIMSNATENATFSIGLHALKKRGFEGGEEPALQDVVDALGIGIDVGWTGLTVGTDPNPVGDEVEVERWVKATDAPINVTPVGRYSPGETLPFGWYTNDNGAILTNEVGILANDIANAQTLFPPIDSGEDSFDPQGAVFGFYVESNTFNRLSYTQDEVNAVQTGGATHRTRIYPMADRAGNLIDNSYLIAFEDATNGDYQDYMFVIDNVIPFESGILAFKFNKEDVGFIASINQEEIPVQQIVLSGNGGITSDAINLVASEEWIVLPDTYQLGTSFDIGVDVTGLPIGSYQAIVTASAPNYDDAVVNVTLDVTNELVYTYQFNFQDPDDIETSPNGYINDVGAAYGVQNTANLGDLTYGWVLPGTSAPADASVNGRNRNTGTNDNVLLKTFTIIGHRTATDFPTRDWIIDLPNGTYSVNLSVGGDPQFSDSNHVLDVNGITVVDYDQQSLVPETFGNFENTKFVDVTDGTLRLALAASGENAKVNFIRLAPVDNSLLPPTIVATFEGNERAPDIYRGTVAIALQATDNSESGGIARLEYVLDNNATEIYDQPISVGEAGAHSLVVTAEDNNGNVTERTFKFTIETPTGALLAIENMTKVPGTERGFPANDYYTFHRLGTPGEALVHDSNIMRLKNTGTGDLIIEAAIVSDTNDYTVEVLDNTGATIELPVTIAPNTFADLDITFIGTTGNGNNGIFVENIEIVSNADNALENTAVLHGAYSPQPEGGDEINAQEVFEAFGFQSSMLSIVNDEGTITPPNNLTFRPSSNFPLAENIDAGYEGDLILSSNFVQADPTKPVIGIQISALHGGPGSNGAKFVAVDGTNTVGGISFSHDARYYQTLLPKTGANINFDTASSISGPFRIAVSNYLSSGGNNLSGDRPDLLGLRIYKVIDNKGNIVPNEYIVLQDFVQGGCGAGSANCDWNDNTFYFINIRPEGVPTTQPAEAYLANVGEEFDLDIAQYFDKGYPGNTLTVSASVANGGLPIWLTYDAVNGILSGTPPEDTTGNVEVDFDAVDTNGLTASTTLTININEPPVAVDDEVTTTQNIAVLLEGLLANDSEPNGQEFMITAVDTPQNGTAELQVDGLSILYTPETDFVGTDSFTYTIEDESGLTASANVVISVTPENQAPEALIVTSTNEGPAALFVEFTGSGSTDDNDVNLQYAWDFGDGTGASTDPDTSYTFTSAGIYTVSLLVTDSENLFNVATTTITVSTPPNTAPTAVAIATPSNSNPLQFGFDGSGSSDTEGAVSYQWNFGDGNSSSEASPSHTYALTGTYDVGLTVTDEGDLSDSVSLQVVVEESNTAPTAVATAMPNSGNPLQFIFNGSASGDTEGDVNYQWNFGDGNSSIEVLPTHTYTLAGPYDVSLTVTDEGGLTDSVTIQVVAENPVSNGFALRINAGGPQLIHNGETFLADTNFVGGKVYVNNNATVPDLYKTERSASPPTFGYNIPLDNGRYQLTLHFAEIYHGATDGGTGGNGKRIFDVTLEGDIVLNDYDINADVGPQTVVTKTFEITVEDGVLNLIFDAAGGDGVDQPKLSAIAVLGIDDPIVECELPEEWTNSDIGAVAADGDTCFDNGRFEVSASGADIWGSADEFHYVYQPFNGDGEIIAQVLSLDPTNVWAKAGVMMRNDLDANSASAMMIISPNPNSIGGPGYSFQHRPTKGATMGNANFTAPALIPGGFPHYVRMVRSGNTFTGYISETNGNWTQVVSTTINMNETIYIGLSTTSHNDGTLTNAVYENVSVTETFAQNEGPTASISADPLNGTAPLLVSFDSSGSDDDTGIISYQWDFKDGGTSTEENPTHTFAPGIFEVTLVVSDAQNETDEASVTITVAAPNTAPTAVASATPNGNNPLQFSFDGSGSGDTQGAIEYLWDFGDGNSSSEVSPTHTYATAGTYEVSLTVSDEGGLTDSITLQVVAEAPITPEFALRINAGGPQVVQDGMTFSADRNFVGGKPYTNVNADLPTLYQTERSALPPNFGYEIPVANGSYKVTLHFAELFWSATGGTPGGVGSRIFDVVIEGNTVLNDYDIIADVGSQTVVTKTFDVIVQDGTISLALDAEGTDGRNEPKISAIEIVSVGTANAAPTAVANSNTVSGEAPLQVSFNANGSDDDKNIASYLWDFKDGGTSSDENPQHTFNTPGIYNVSLTVSDDEGETDEAIVAITVDEPVVNDFALRINAGGPSLTHDGKEFSADRNFVGGKSYVNNAATVPTLYKTERSALPANFGYAIPLDNGTYQVTLHFAEIFWGAQGGLAGGIGKRIFDVRMEGETILDNYDIIAEVGSQIVVTKTFDVTISDGELNLGLDAEGSDGRNEPKLSAIEIVGLGAVSKSDPIVNAGVDQEVLLPEAILLLAGTGSDPDGGTVSYQWTQVDGPDTALLTNDNTAELNAEVLVEGNYTFRLTVTDDENVSAFDEVTVTAVNPNLEEVWLEAECAIVGSGWTTVNDGSQSGEQYLAPPSSFQSSPSNNASSIVSFDFSVSAGSYKIFGLVRTPSGTQDSFWVRINGGSWVRWNSIPPSNNFAWHRIHLNEQLSQPRSFELVEGVNRIDIGHREGGVGLDKLYVTQTDNIPTGLGGTSTNCGDVNPSFDSSVVTDNSGNANKTVPAAYNDPIPNKVSMYPNAAVTSTQITMSNPEADITKLYVYDVAGRLIRSYEGLELETSPGAYVLQVSNLNNGIYLLRMVATDGNIFDEKLVVRH